MRLISAQRADDIQSRVKAQFAEFNRTSAPSKGRKYPNELQALARQALAEGIPIPTLCRLTGVSSTALDRWSKETTAKQVRPRRPSKVTAPRRLEVIGDDIDKRRQAIIVRLPSGVSLELGDASALSGDLLALLAALGGDHAASR